MGLDSVKYNAFISYRHAPLDSYVAKTLHKMLETYKIPTDVAQRLPEDKRCIARIFRDEEELPLADNLSDPIDEALHNAEFLIVICTPRLKDSKWCQKEISSFVQYHGRDHVLCVLAEGEPEDSFPDILTKETYTSTNEAGEEVLVTREFEPLAAEARGLNEREIRKNLKTATVRLTAALLGLNYDDLRQRHKERKMKRTIRICTGIASVLLVFSVICFALLLKISRQKNTISAQYDEILYENASNMAEIADLNLDKGKPDEALEGLLNVMPSSLGDTSKPYNAKALYALNDCLGTYREKPYFMADNVYAGESAVTYFTVSPLSSRILLVEDSDYVSVFNVSDRSNIGHYPVETMNMSCFSPFFISEDSFVYASGADLHLFNVTSGTDEKVGYASEIYALPGKTGEFFMFADGMLTKVHEDCSKEYEIDLNELAGFWEGMYVYDADYDEATEELSFAYGNNDTNLILVGDVYTKTGEVYLLRETYQADNAVVCQDANSVYVYYDEMSYFGNIYNMIASYDKETGEANAFCTTQNASFRDIMLYGKNVAMVGHFNFAVFDTASGLITDSVYSYEDLMYAYEDADKNLMLVGANGSVYKYAENATALLDCSGDVFYHAPKSYIYMAEYNQNNELYLLLPQADYVTRYGKESVDVEKEIVGSRILCEESDASLKVQRTVGGGTYEVYDTSNNELLGTIEDIRGIPYGIHYYEDIEKYVFNAGTYGYLLDQNFDVIARMFHVDAYENGMFTVYDGNCTYKLPYVSYDLLMENARNE